MNLFTPWVSKLCKAKYLFFLLEAIHFQFLCESLVEAPHNIIECWGNEIVSKQLPFHVERISGFQPTNEQFKSDTLSCLLLPRLECLGPEGNSRASPTSMWEREKLILQPVTHPLLYGSSWNNHNPLGLALFYFPPSIICQQALFTLFNMCCGGAMLMYVGALNRLSQQPRCLTREAWRCSVPDEFWPLPPIPLF